MANEIPLVSVIVPMYNSEKFIGELLNSLLGQTLKNFEVIIVDDCSTDYSCALVESYMPQFEGRLYLVKIKSNTGGPSLPRNKGLEVSRGKYVFFMDNDDALTRGALEFMYNFAEHFQAEIVCCKKHFESHGFAQDFLKNMTVVGNAEDNKLEVTVGDFQQKVRAWMYQGFLGVVPWTKFILRNFLVENDIKWLPVIQEDSIWTFELACLTKKCVLIPQPVYVARMRADSFGHTALFAKNLDAKSLKLKMDRVVNGLKHIDNFMSGIEGFQKSPELRYEVLSYITFQNLNWVIGTYPNVPPHLLYETFKAAFPNNFGDNDVLVSALFTAAVTFIKNNTILRQQISTTPPHFRIKINLMRKIYVRKNWIRRADFEHTAGVRRAA